MKKISIKDMTNFILKTVLMSIIAAFFPLLLVIYPGEFIYKSVKDGILYSILMLILGGLVFMYLTSQAYGLFIVKTFGLFVILASILLQINMKKEYRIILGAIGLFVFLVFFLYDLGLTKEYLNSEKIYRDFLNIYSKGLKSVGLDEKALSTTFRYNFYAVLRIFPGILMIFSLATSYLSNKLAVDRLNKEVGGVYEKIDFTNLKMPISMGILAIICFGLTFLDVKDEFISMAILNLYILFVFIFSVEGISFIFNKLNTLTKSVVPKVVVILICLYLLPMQFVIAGIGLVDCFVNLRKFKR